MANRVGEQFGSYRLIHLLGRGGFAEVYLGQHLRLNMQAAIKILHTRLADEDVEGFQREAQTIASLVHLHIIRVLDFDVKDGVPFLVMDYAPNGTLRQRHPKGVALPLPAITSYVKQVADALQYAHNEKLIHRDIKPQNMLLGRRSEILLSDFGIATIAYNTSSQRVQEMAGTVSYMAPEQIQGYPRPASDQYSLGIVVYEWLSGDYPFHGSFTEIAVKHSIVPPPPLREKVPTISPEIEQVVLKALAKDHRQRFASVQEFASAFEQACQSSLSFSLTTPSSQSSLSSSPTPLMSQPPSISGSNIPPSIAPQPFSPDTLPGSPQRPKRVISRRVVLVGLGGLVVAGGGITTWLLLTTGSRDGSSATYPQVVLGDGPISYWRLNEASGNVAYDQTGNDNGTITGGVTLGQSGPIPGGGSFAFDGSTGYVDLGTNPNLQPQQWTFEAWFRATSETSNPAKIYRNRYNGFELEVGPTGVVGLSIWADSSTSYSLGTSSGTNYLDGTWHYVVVTRSANQLIFYIDATEGGSTATPVSGTYYRSNGVAIGRDGSCSCLYFKGSIAEAAIYPTALTATQVVTHYNAASRNTTIKNNSATTDLVVGN